MSFSSQVSVLDELQPGADLDDEVLVPKPELDARRPGKT